MGTYPLIPPDHLIMPGILGHHSQNTKKMSNESSSSGISFLGLLTLIFIALKLTGTIAWSWWWVLSPLWAPMCLVIAIFAVAMIFYAIASLFK